jgi:hypothetical protein
MENRKQETGDVEPVSATGGPHLAVLRFLFPVFHFPVGTPEVIG